MILKQFDRTRQKSLLVRLELYYSYRLFSYKSWQDNYALKMKKTNAKAVDRRHRIEIKAIEILLEKLDSKLFNDGKKSSIRKTMQIKAQCTVFSEY